MKILFGRPTLASESDHFIAFSLTMPETHANDGLVDMGLEVHVEMKAHGSHEPSKAEIIWWAEMIKNWNALIKETLGQVTGVA